MKFAKMRRNPYFIGINSAMNHLKAKIYLPYSRNPYFIGINSAIKESEFKKRSLNVAILILLELTLQCEIDLLVDAVENGRNPYFIGINSAIDENYKVFIREDLSQSLFYWN